MRTNKYGIIVPNDVIESKQIDTENKKTLWWDVNILEMNNVRPEFEVYKGDKNDLVVYKGIKFCFFQY